MSKVIRASGMAQAAQRAFTLFPNVESAALRLTAYLTDRFPADDGGCLLGEALKAGFAGIRQEKGAEEPSAFMVGMVAMAAPQMKSKRVGVDTHAGPVFWVPFEESFQDFLRRHADAKVITANEAVPGAISDGMAAMMLAVRIMASDADRIMFAVMSKRIPGGIDLSGQAA
ncbi:MAG: hypothetical protein WAO76_12550 [Georgfuchsia sp.]